MGHRQYKTLGPLELVLAAMSAWGVHTDAYSHLVIRIRRNIIWGLPKSCIGVLVQAPLSIGQYIGGIALLANL